MAFDPPLKYKVVSDGLKYQFLLTQPELNMQFLKSVKGELQQFYTKRSVHSSWGVLLQLL